MGPATLRFAGVTQLVECNLAKVDVAGSNPVSRSKKFPILSELTAPVFVCASMEIGTWARSTR